MFRLPDYSKIGKMLLMVDPLPPGAMPIYDKDVKAFHIQKKYSDIGHPPKQGDEDKDEGTQEQEDQDDEIIIEMPPIASVKADFQMLDYQVFDAFFSAIFAINNKCKKQQSIEDFLAFIMPEAALYEPMSEETEKDFVKNIREKSKISYVIHLFTDVIFFNIEEYELEVKSIVMSKEYFLYLHSLIEKYVKRTGDDEYQDVILGGSFLEIPIFISKFAPIPFACFDLAKDEPHKDNPECELPTKRQIVEKYTDVFNSDGSLKKDAIAAKSLIKKESMSW